MQSVDTMMFEVSQVPRACINRSFRQRNQEEYWVAKVGYREPYTPKIA